MVSRCGGVTSIIMHLFHVGTMHFSNQSAFTRQHAIETARLEYKTANHASLSPPHRPHRYSHSPAAVCQRNTTLPTPSSSVKTSTQTLLPPLQHSPTSLPRTPSCTSLQPLPTPPRPLTAARTWHMPRSGASPVPAPTMITCRVHFTLLYFLVLSLVHFTFLVPYPHRP